MSEPAIPANDAAQNGPDHANLIADLRAAGADRFDPVRLYYIEALSRRAQAHQGTPRRLLDERLIEAIGSLRRRLEDARAKASAALARTLLESPQAAEALRPLLDNGDFRTLHARIAQLKAGSQSKGLSELLRALETQTAQQAEPAGMPAALSTSPAKPELKTLRNHRRTWSRLSISRQLEQAIEQAPRNAGPINSHMLMVRSLATMRELSPDYLSHFMSWADTLLCLDPGEKDKEKPRAEKPKADKPKKARTPRQAKGKT